MLELDSKLIEDTLKILKNLQEIKDNYGEKTLTTILESIKNFFCSENNVDLETSEKKDLKEFERISNENYKLKDLELYRMDKEKETESSRSPLDTSIYSQEPTTLKRVEEDRKNHPVLGEIKRPNLYDEEGAEDNNPWASAGKPIAPGQIEF